MKEIYKLSCEILRTYDSGKYYMMKYEIGVKQVL
jgi:hypothetical protein